jgi:hypothetical protein
MRFEVEGPLAPIQLCHCSQCRKAQGAAFGANIPVAANAFRWLQGEDLLREYRASPGKRRVFCSTCGSPLFSQRDEAPETIRLRVGTLDGDGASLGIGFHIQTASKAAWWTIADDHRQYPGVGP